MLIRMWWVHRIGQDGGMFTEVLYPRVCSPKAAFCEGVKANPFPVNPL